MSVRLSKNGKRLGRPPKNKDAQVAPVTKAVFVVAQEPQETEPVDGLIEIECELLPIKSVSSIEGSGERYGRYSSSVRSMSKFGPKAWVAIAYLKADFSEHRKAKIPTQEIIQKCVNYLNRIERKKYQKKEAAPKFGYLRLYDPENINFINKFGHEVAVVELVTDDRKNENFWGEGGAY